VVLNSLRFPSSDGTGNQVLITDGSGNLGWATVATGSFTHITNTDGTASLTGSSAGVVDSFPAGTYRSAKYSVSMWDSTNSRAGIQEFYVTHDGSSAYISTTTGITSTGTDMATFTADIDSGNVRVLATLASSDGTTALAASSGDSIQQSPSTSTTLSADIDDSQNYIPVVSTTDFSTSVVAEIETTNEVVSFTDISENNFTYSQDLTNWHSNSNVTVTSNATTAPDGTLTADSVQTITTGSTSYVRNNTFGVTTQSTPLTLSFYVKGTGFIQLSTNTFWVGNGYTNVNCATGETYAPTNFSGITSSDVGNGWWRIQMSAPASNWQGGFLFSVVDTISSARQSASNDTSLKYIWGVQWERVPNGVINTTGGTNTSTYLPTTTTALVGLTGVTRGVDITVFKFNKTLINV